MAGKESKNVTVIIKVDLGCSCCSKKIKWALCKLQKEFNISSIVFDVKKNTITVSGAFNADCFIKKIRCMACKVIICIEIKPPKVDPAPPPPPPTEVNVSVSICCCRPCPCYQPHLGCIRCCSCGHVSTCPPSKSSCSGDYPCGQVSTCPPSRSSCSTCPPSRSLCPPSSSSCSTCPPSSSSCARSRSSCSGGYPCCKVVCEEEPFYGCSIL